MELAGEIRKPAGCSFVRSFVIPHTKSLDVGGYMATCPGVEISRWMGGLDGAKERLVRAGRCSRERNTLRSGGGGGGGGGVDRRNSKAGLLLLSVEYVTISYVPQLSILASNLKLVCSCLRQEERMM
jgi:hypothetical protein